MRKGGEVGMTFGQLFTTMHPDVRAIENGSCVWLFMDEVNHYTIAAKWWNQEVAGDALELLQEQEPKHGRWVRLTGMAPPEYHGHKICSPCGSLAPYDPIHMGREILPKYCPGCGAEMEGEAE